MSISQGEKVKVKETELKAGSKGEWSLKFVIVGIQCVPSSSCWWRVCRPVWTFVHFRSPGYIPHCGTLNAEALYRMLQWEMLIKCRVGSSVDKAYSWCPFVTHKLSWCSMKASPQADDVFRRASASPCWQIIAQHHSDKYRALWILLHQRYI